MRFDAQAAGIDALNRRLGSRRLSLDKEKWEIDVVFICAEAAARRARILNAHPFGKISRLLAEAPIPVRTTPFLQMDARSPVGNVSLPQIEARSPVAMVCFLVGKI